MIVASDTTKLVGRMVRRLPPPLAARLDLLLRTFKSHWDVPLNGQERRREILEEIAASFDFDLVVETGTFRGGTTRLLADTFTCPVRTVEAHKRFFLYSGSRLRDLKNVTVELGDSRDFLRCLETTRPDAVVFAYLDAHWDKSDLPLAQELRIIARLPARAIVMIDDFEVPGDTGYGFDEYGPEAKLAAGYLPSDALAGWSLHYPAASSREETGRRRGCCVLVSPSLNQDWTTLGNGVVL